MRAPYFFFCSSAIFLLSACSDLGSYQNPTLTTTPLPSASSSPVSVPAIHEWQFEGNGNDTGTVGGWTGALHGAASYSSVAADVEVGSEALKLTGASGDYFDIGPQTIPTASSVACWVRWMSGGSGQNTILSNTTTNGATPNGFILSVSSSTGQISLETGNGTTTSNVSSVSFLSSGVYTHVVVTMDSLGDAADIYVNGAFDSSGALQSGFLLTGVGNTYFGSMTGSYAPFLGDLDDCQIYNFVLSSAQVSALYGSY